MGDDPEGFSGYGPARYFRSAQVLELSEELSRPEVGIRSYRTIRSRENVATPNLPRLARRGAG